VLFLRRCAGTTRVNGSADRRSARAAALLALATAVVLLPGATRAGTSSSWSEVRTPRFTVLSAGSATEAQRVAGALEAFREAFRRLVPDAKVDPIAPTLVLAFDRFDTYEPYAPRFDGRPVRVAGSFVGSAPVNYLAITMDEGPRAWSVAYHELTHLIVTQTLNKPPAWFNEGIAEFYSTFTLTADGKQAELGHLIPEHLILLRRERWLPLDDLFEVTTSSPLYNEGDKRSMFYAESWALMHYLFSRGPDRAARLFEFLGRLENGQSPGSAFRTSFGMAPSTLQEELERYVQQSEWPVQRYALGERLTSDGHVTNAESLSEAEALATLAGLQLRLGRLDEALGLAQMAANIDPQCTAAWVMLAIAHIDQKLDVEAIPFLQRAASLPLRDPYAAYLLGSSAIRVHEQAGDSALPRVEALRVARRSLEEAVAAAPTYAEAWASLSHGLLAAGTEPNKALSASRRAHSLAPTRRHYLLLQAQALMQRDDLDAARRMMHDLIEQDLGTPLADKAAEVLARIAALEEGRSRREGGR
jgi:tetratricopeptide (TPR) repeat protein